MNVTEASKILGVSPRKVYAMAAPAGPIPCYRIGKRVIFDQSDVIGYKESCRSTEIKNAVHLSLNSTSVSMERESARVRDVIRTAERMEKAESSKDPLNTLSTRTRNCLRAENLRTVESVRAALDDGRIDEVPNFGPVSKKEVIRWLAGVALSASA